MRIEVLADTDAVARRAAAFLTEAARRAIAARGRFVVAVSGGRTPWAMLRAFAGETLDWNAVHVFQADERVAPDGHADRNLTHLRESLGRAPIPSANVHAMPVLADDVAVAAANYARELEAVAGSPPVLDVVHLGLGTDGHTASLVPGDSALDVTNADVAPTGVYGGRARLTLTFPVLDRARSVLWVVTGAEKAAMLARLAASDRSIPAGRVRSDRALVLADAAAVAAR